MSKFSVFLKELLTQSGEPIARIAKNAGLERTSIHKALKDERILSYSALRQLIQYLQLTLPQVRELNQYYEMLLQGEETYHTREAISELLSDLSQLHFSAQEPPEALKALARAIPEHLPQNGLIYGRPQIEAALENIFEWETSQDEAQMSMYLPGESSLFSGLFYLWRAGRRFDVHQLVAFLPQRSGDDTRRGNLKLLRRLLPLALVSRGQYSVYYYFAQDAAFVNIDPLPFFVITPHYLIRMDDRLSVAQIETAPKLIGLYEKRFTAVLTECQMLTAYSSDVEQILASYMRGTDTDSYFVLMSQPCLGHYYTRERIAGHFWPEVPNREYLIDLSDRRFERLRRLTGDYYTIFTEDGLRKFAMDGIMADLPPELIMPVPPGVRKELLTEFREDIAAGHIFGCIADMERLPVPPYLTLTCDPKFGVHIYATQEFIDGAYACNLHLEESSIGQAFCEFIQALPGSRYVYPKQRTLDILDELIKEIADESGGGSL